MRTRLLLLLLALPLVLPDVLADESEIAEGRARAALADRDYARAVAMFRELAEKSPDSPRADYRAMMALRGLSLAGDHAAVISGGEEFLGRTHPESRYREKVAFLTARALLAAGRGAEASELMALAVGRLRAPAARAYLVGYYLRAADRAFEGVPPGGPFDPGVKPDYARAHRLYSLARRMGIPERMRDAVLLRLARAGVMTKGFSAALDALDERDRSRGEPDPASLLLRGKALLGLEKRREAVEVLERLLAAAPRSPEAPESLLLLDDAPHLERLVREHPDHPRAPEAAWRRGLILAKEGSADAAVAAFLDAADRFPSSPYASRSALAAADTLRKAGRYEEAQGRYDEFLRRYPESPEWAAARERLIESWYMQGRGFFDRGAHEAAAKIWGKLRTTYPLSPYAPRTLFELAAVPGSPDAVRYCREVVARYPKSPEAPKAALVLARRLAAEPGRIREAVAVLSRIVADYANSASAGEARGLLDEMQRERITLVLESTQAPGAEGTLSLSTRNIRKVAGRVYRIDPVAYFEKHGSLARLGDVMVEVIAPDAVFDHEVEGYEDHRLCRSDVAVPVSEAGAYIVVVEGGKLRASCLLLLSDLTVVTKEWPTGVLAFVTRGKSGRPAPGATVLVKDARGGAHRTATGEDGVARLAVPNPAGTAGVLAVLEGSVAFSGYGPARREVSGLETRVHVSTDRPVYRPGHEARYRVVVRRAAGDYLETPAGERVVVSVTDGAGNRLHHVEKRLSEFGTAAGSFRLPDDLPPREYRIAATFDGKAHESPFVVEAYRKPRVFLDVASDPSVVRGDTVELTVTARYSFGRPVAGLVTRVKVGLGAESELTATRTTDESGRAVVEVPTHPGPDLPLYVLVEARDATGRLNYVSRRIVVPRAAYRASVTANRDRVFVAEEVKVRLLTFDVLGEPVAAEGGLDVGRSPIGTDPPAFDLEARIPVSTAEDGRAEVSFTPGLPGRYRLLYRGQDRRGNEVTAATVLEVLEVETDRVVIRADRSTYAVGDVAKVQLASPAAGAWALLTYEGEEVYGYRVLELADGLMTLEVPVTAELVPDVWIRAAVAHEGCLEEGEERIEVRQPLRVTVEPERTDHAPGDLCRLKVRTEDDSGRPLPAEVALAVVDEGIFALHRDRTRNIVATFLPPKRKDLVRTGSSLDFRYEGATSALSEDLLAERDRRLADRNETDDDAGVMLEEEPVADAELKAEEKSEVGIGGGAGGAFAGRGGHRSLKAMGGGALNAVAESPVEPRKSFEDTAYYRADVVTGPDGSAVVEFTLPDDLTEWRVTALGATRGNAFGSGRAALTTSLPLVVRAALPRYLREGDRLTAAAGVVNGTDRSVEATVTLLPTEGGGEVRESVAVPAGRERSVAWPLAGGTAGEAVCRARAQAASGAADAEERRLRTLPFGVKHRTGFAGVTTEPGERDLVLPEDAVSGTVRLTLHVAPTLTRAALDGVGELTEFPYGCTEQTVNRFLPALEAARAIRDLGLDESKALPELLRVARAGALRLTYLQNPEGLWGWWRRGPTDPAMTAYALIGLARARDAGIEVSPKALARAEKALPKLEASVTDPDAKAFLLLARSWAFGADAKTLAQAATSHSALGVRGMAHVVLACEPHGERALAGIVAGEIERRLTREKDLDTESLGWALAALAGYDADSPATRDLAARLARRREGRGFGTTKATGAAVMGLARAARAFGAPERGAEVSVRVNGEEVLRETISDGGPLAGRSIHVPAERLEPGRNAVEVSGSGGAFLYSLALETIRRDAPESTGPLALSRTLSLVPGASGTGEEDEKKLLREGGRVRHPQVGSVRAGEVVRVTLELENPGRERYLVVEDPIPAGFELVPDTPQGPFAEALRYDDRMVFFLADAPERAAVSYLMQGEAAGEVRAPPAVAYAMYRPAAAAWTVPLTLHVADFGEKVDRDPTLGLSASGLLAAARAAEAAERHEDVVRYLTALLERYELELAARADALRLLARAEVSCGDFESAAAALTRLAAESPTGPILGDELLLADVLRRLGRHGEAVGAMERATAKLFALDARVSEEVGTEATSELVVEILDRYPFAPYTEAAWISVANRQATAFEAAAEKGDPADLRALEEYLARYPESGSAPRIAFRLARAWLRARRWEELEREARRFSDRYPASDLRDDADWFVAFALFAQNRYPEAESAALASLAREYPQQPSRRTSYERNLVHLLAQVAHVTGRLEEAVNLYRQVEDHIPDAREALRELTEVRLDLPAVTRAGLADPLAVLLTVKNIEEAEVHLYPIDLLAYFALEKDVRTMAGLNLDGLPPAAVERVRAEGARREAREVRLPLPDLEPGVYLVIARAGGIERRGILIQSDLDARIRRHPEGVRVLVSDRRTGAPVPGAFVKVAAGGNMLGEGRTDARGVFEAGGTVRGALSAVARKGRSFALASE